MDRSVDEAERGRTETWGAGDERLFVALLHPAHEQLVAQGFRHQIRTRRNGSTRSGARWSWMNSSPNIPPSWTNMTPEKSRPDRGRMGRVVRRRAGKQPGFLYQQNTLRDALVAGVTLNIFNNHADRVKMANIAQMIQRAPGDDPH